MAEYGPGWVQLKNGSSVDDPRLDRVHSGHTKHLDKYPLTTATIPDKKVGGAAGINWYSDFDNPQPIKVRGRTYMAIGRDPKRLGNIRGGHCVALMPYGMVEPISWWDYYNQGVEGRCVEFGWARVISWFNRQRLDITSRYPYYWMQEHDWWPGGSYPMAQPVYEGTSVDAGAQFHHQVGGILARRGGGEISLYAAPSLVRPDQRIGAYRWTSDWGLLREALDIPDWMPGVPFPNSWGRSYPRRTLLLDDAGQRVANEDGELALITDR